MMARLDEVAAGDASWLATATDWSRTRRWSLRGRTPSPHVLRVLLTDRVTLQRTARVTNGTPVALFQLVDVDTFHGHGQIALVADQRRPVEVRRAAELFVDLAFDGCDIRKICVLAHEDELDISACFGGLATSSGRLASHDRRDESTYADLLLYEIWRPTT
jgi:hypothetical protein